jgi:hypothetical protein
VFFGLFFVPQAGIGQSVARKFAAEGYHVGQSPFSMAQSLCYEASTSKHKGIIKLATFKRAFCLNHFVDFLPLT